MMMSNWNGTILGPPHVGFPAPDVDGCGCVTDCSWLQSVHENRIYSVNIHCGPDYPDNPPTFQFISAVNIPCVDQRTGKVRSYGYHNLEEGELSVCCQVDPTKLPCLAQWKREYNMETVLIELRRLVAPFLAFSGEPNADFGS